MPRIYAHNVSAEEFERNHQAANKKQKRASRPGQRAPVNRTGSNGRRTGITADIEFEDTSEPGRPSAQVKEGDSEWKQRQQRKLQSFAQKRDKHKQCMQHYAAFQEQDDQSDQMQQVSDHMQMRMVSAIMRHHCHSLLSPAEQLQLLDGQPASGNETYGVVAVISRRVVALHDLGASIWMSVPQCRCSCCHGQWEVLPADVGCFASSPDQPWVWFTSKLLQLYTSLKFTSGIGSSNFAEGCNSIASVIDASSAAARLAPGPAGLGPLPTMRPWHLETAWQEWRRVGTHAQHPRDLVLAEMKQLGPGIYCPSCAATPDCQGAAEAIRQDRPVHTIMTYLPGNYASGDNGGSSATAELMRRAEQAGLLPGTQEQTLMLSATPLMKAVCFDANVKANRYKMVGHSGTYDCASQTLTRFIGAAHQKVWQLKAEGPLPVAPPRQNLAAEDDTTATADDVDLELEGRCHPKLSCARETSSQSGVSDECGLVGAVCSHGQPLLGMFIAMPAPERFLYYDVLMEQLLSDVAVSIMYLDTGCTYSKHVSLYGDADAPRPEFIKVPWWHAIGHRSQCFLVNSGLYLPGAGRRVGEYCEQLWAQAKPLASLTRYMAKHNYLDCWDDFLEFVAGSKLANFVSFMLAQHRTAVRKLGECKKTCRDLIEAAGQKDIPPQDLWKAAVDAAQPPQPPVTTATQLSSIQQLMVNYVRHHKHYKVLVELRQEAAALSVALPNREGRTLHARSQDTTTINKLQLKLGQLMTHMQMSDPPATDGAEYKAALAVVRDEELGRVQAEIEGQVSALAVMNTERSQQGTASAVTRSQQNSMKRRRKRVRDLVAVMQSWQQVDAPSSPVLQQLPAVWTETDIKQLYADVYPWRRGPTAERAAALAVLADKFRDACAEEARCLEEMVLQKYERLRIQQYYLHVSDVCKKAAAAKAGEADSVLQQVSEAVPEVSEGCTEQHREQLACYAQLAADCVLLQRHADKFESWYQNAASSFNALPA